MPKMQAQKIIVIDPGSQNLRIGRASDLNPLTILNAIGRRRRETKAKQTPYHDTLLPRIHSDLQLEFEEHRLEISRNIQAYVTHDTENGTKRLRVATPPQQIATFNRRSLPEAVESGHAADEHTTPTGEATKAELTETIFDQEILNLNADTAQHYNIHFPMRRGELHVHSSIGGSTAAVLNDLEQILLYAIRRLDIDTAQLPQQYSAVLLIPDIYNRNHLRELVTLLLQRLCFRACFLLQENVAATFGAGLGYACVVDVGDQKCSVSCVEDGISQSKTRVRLAYGGGDVTQAFMMQLRKCCFPYKECNTDTSYADAVLVQALKERFCHINPDICGAQERTFLVRVPQQQHKRLRYTLQLGDECIVAPLGLFHTELLNITGKPKMARVQLRSNLQPDAEDCFDAEYIRETGRRNGRDQLLEGGALPNAGDAADDELVVDAIIDERDTNAKQNDKEDQLYIQNGQILSIDQTVARSIERCSSEELKRKMYGCILLVGGSSKFPGFAKWLEQKITLHVAMSQQNRASEYPTSAYTAAPFEVNVFAKDMDATIIAWKGAAIMSMLESAPELWIQATEWERHGLRVLREKAPFIW